MLISNLFIFDLYRVFEAQNFRLMSILRRLSMVSVELLEKELELSMGECSSSCV